MAGGFGQEHRRSAIRYYVRFCEVARSLRAIGVTCRINDR
jgi:hypothetical protein